MFSQTVRNVVLLAQPNVNLKLSDFRFLPSLAEKKTEKKQTSMLDSKKTYNLCKLFIL